MHKKLKFSLLTLAVTFSIYLNINVDINIFIHDETLYTAFKSQYYSEISQSPMTLKVLKFMNFSWQIFKEIFAILR